MPPDLHQISRVWPSARGPAPLRSLLGGRSRCLGLAQSCSSRSLPVHDLAVMFAPLELIQGVDIRERTRGDNVGVRSLAGHPHTVVFDDTGHAPLCIRPTSNGVHRIANQL